MRGKVNKLGLLYQNLRINALCSHLKLNMGTQNLTSTFHECVRVERFAESFPSLLCTQLHNVQKHVCWFGSVRQNKECLADNSELRLTYRQKLLKADLIVLVAVEFLDDVPDHVARLGMADTFQELLELVVTYMFIFVHICKRKSTKRQDMLSSSPTILSCCY